MVLGRPDHYMIEKFDDIPRPPYIVVRGYIAPPEFNDDGDEVETDDITNDMLDFWEPDGTHIGWLNMRDSDQDVENWEEGMTRMGLILLNLSPDNTQIKVEK